MARVLRKTDAQIANLADAVNDLKAYVVDSLRKVQADVATATGAGTSFGAPGSHNDRSERTVTAANASDLATSLTLVNQIRAVYEFHRVDTLAHKAKDTTNTISAPAATTLATAITLANELKTDYNAHRSQAGVHEASDSGNAVSSANATDQSSLNTLLNEMKTDINNHMAGGVSAKSVRAVPA